MNHRQRLINSMCAMFNEQNGLKSSPAWLLELYAGMSDKMITEMANNWMKVQPKLYSKHGLYVM